MVLTAELAYSTFFTGNANFSFTTSCLLPESMAGPMPVAPVVPCLSIRLVTRRTFTAETLLLFWCRTRRFPKSKLTKSEWDGPSPGSPLMEAISIATSVSPPAKAKDLVLASFSETRETSIAPILLTDAEWMRWGVFGVFSTSPHSAGKKRGRIHRLAGRKPSRTLGGAGMMSTNREWTRIRTVNRRE